MDCANVRRRIRRTSFAASIVCLAVTSHFACDGGSDGETPRQIGELQYEMTCDVELLPTAEPPTIFVETNAASADEGMEALWVAACTELALEPGCQQTNHLIGSPACSQVTASATGSIQPTEAEATYHCNMTVEDRRNVETIQHQARETRPESQVDLDTFCRQAILDACTEAGAQGDCTAGDEAPYLASYSSSRSLVH